MILSKHLKIIRNFLPTLLSGSIILAGFASNHGFSYTPPSSPELYEKTDLSKRPLPLVSHSFVGAGLTFGQSQSTGSENPRASFLGSAQLGYLFKTSDFNLIEVEANILTGTSGHQDAKLDIPFGLLLRAGYGGTMGSSMYWVLKLGGGIAQTSLDQTIDGIKLSADTTASLASMSWQAGVRATPQLTAFGGLDITQLNASFSEIKNSATTSTSKGNVVVNMFQILFGLKYAL